jgi:cation-transporting ATPase E
MTKDQNIDELEDDELTEYLDKNNDEDLTADSTEEVEEENDEEDDIEPIIYLDDDENKDEDLIKIPYDHSLAKVKEEISLQSPKEQRKEQRAERKEKARLLREKNKKIRAHRKYLKNNPSTLVRYDTNIELGLPLEVVEQRTLDELTNTTGGKKSKSIPRIIFSNVVTFFNILIFIIAGFLIAVGAVTDLAFLIIVTINIVIGTVQEIRAKKMIDELSLMSSPYAKVKRGGEIKEIPTDEVVLDDLILLEPGKQICADSILLDGQVEVNESLLTGEADAIVKKPGDVLLSGSFIVSGRCQARVDKVGKDNYIEHLSNQAKVYKKPKSDLLISLNRIIQIMSIPIILIGVALFLIMYFRNSIDLTTSIRKTAGAMVGMIPSGLFLMSSIALFVGVIRLSQKKVLVQELYCIEMLARVDCICLDKTGTITDGTMVVKNVIDYNTIYGLATKNIISAILNALHDNNMTSQALEAKFGLGKRIKHTAAIPFSSQRKYQAVTFDKFGTFILGAPEFVLGNDFKNFSRDVEKYAKLGYRVLCLAHREGIIHGGNLPDSPIQVASMILIEDNIRPDAIETIKYFKESGVDVRVISGDNPITVSKISQRAGIEEADKYISLDGMSDQDVIRAALEYRVFGRVSPSQKKLIIQTLKAAGKTVAMTGDGVNDILALREADCSIALASGSDAARNCSHLVLLDSNFGSMPQVVAEGRRVINNVTSVASLFLTKTIFSLFLAIQALATGTYPISAIQLILIDTLAIGVPSLLLVNEPNNNPVVGRFLPNVIKKALPGALVILFISLIVFGLANQLNMDNLTLTTIIVIAATHTCLMVLYKACKPFNSLRKWLFVGCYAVFLFAITVLPQLLEFRPIFSWAEYYSDNVKTEYISKYPSVEISKGNYYVIDGKVSSIQANNNYSTINLTMYDETKDANKTGKKYYAINNEKTDYEIAMPTVSFNESGHIFLGGYKINDLKYHDGIEKEIVTDKDGYLYHKYTDDNGTVHEDPLYITLTKSNSYYDFQILYGNYKESEAVKHYKILPTVEMKNGEYIINGVQSTEYRYQASKTDINNNTKPVATINPETMELLINGSPIYKTYNDGTVDTHDTYKVSIPTITSTGNRTQVTSTTTLDERNDMYFGGVDTNVSIFEVYGHKEVYYDELYNARYNYTIAKADGNGGYIYYKYYKATGKVYKFLRVEPGKEYIYDENGGSPKSFFDGEPADDALVADFVFDGFNSEEDFTKYYSVDSNLDGTMGAPGYAINVNDAVNRLQASVEASDSTYRLSYDSTITTDDVKTLATLDNSLYAPSIVTTEAGHYIINGYYSEYEYGGGDLSPRKDENNYLVLNNTKTNYLISSNDINITKGGIVKFLSAQSKIFLLMLCLLAGPLMKILRNAIPWIRKQAKIIQGFISKF